MTAPLPHVGVIGLGIMGGTMASALRRAGYPVSGHDPLPRMRQPMLDAPISGTATGHPETAWIMYLSGPAAACRSATPIVRTFTLQAPRVGEFGAGMRLKIAANHLVAIYNVAYGEMTTLCRRMGLDPAIALQHMASSPYIGTGLMGLRQPLHRGAGPGPGRAGHRVGGRGARRTRGSDARRGLIGTTHAPAAKTRSAPGRLRYAAREPRRARRAAPHRLDRPQEPPMPITKGCKALVAEANALITTHSVEQVRERLGRDPRLQMVDIRDPRELEREGCIPGALHAPRGMLEFWVDPESPYFKPVFADESREFVLFCGGGWRSALAARSLHEMGMRNVAHMEGGFGAWKQAGAPLETWADHQAASARRKSIR